MDIKHTSKYGNINVTIKLLKKFTNTATLDALPLASELKSSEVATHGIGPGPIEKNTIYKTTDTADM